MSLSKILSLALAVAVVHASCLPNTPSRVLQSAGPPAPSTYPLGDACGHEWQYLNFDPEHETDIGRLQTLHNVICSGELRTLSSHGKVSALAGDNVYLRYFPKSDEDDDTQAQVSSVLGLIAGTDGAIGSVVESFVVDNKDFSEDIPCTEDTFAYTDTDPVDDREKIHFCDRAFALPSIASVDCNRLDPYPSDLMDTFSRVVLHEMMHYSSVGPESELQCPIIDVKNNDLNYAYGPSRVHGLIDPDQDGQSGKPEINADSYAWMSLDAWISRKCTAAKGEEDWVSYFTGDLPPYTDSDSEEVLDHVESEKIFNILLSSLGFFMLKW
ncbi:hypothetical protein B0H13DRAFT_1610500 [Mycena leptocephala]|nr:hypothetical protein B0H13DRAFT_1610500 [Mycena leptocephala]